MNKIPEALRAELDALLAQPVAKINFVDIAEATISDWARAERGQFYCPTKQSAPGANEYVKVD